MYGFSSGLVRVAPRELALREGRGRGTLEEYNILPRGFKSWIIGEYFIVLSSNEAINSGKSTTTTACTGKRA
jgi:hypothetical protein